MKRIVRLLALATLAAGLPTAWANENQITGVGLSLQPSPYDYGSVNLGDSSPGQIFTLQNDSADTATITSALIGGFNPDQFILGGTTCSAGLVLDPGESCSALVTFAPTNAGHQTALLRIFYNQPPPAPPGDAEIDATLSGDGIAPPPAAPPVPTPALGPFAVFVGIALIVLAAWSMRRRNAG
jgi:hypothetical protein